MVLSNGDTTVTVVRQCMVLVRCRFGILQRECGRDIVPTNAQDRVIRRVEVLVASGVGQQALIHVDLSDA